MPLSHRRLTDARDMAALAHPLRLDLLDLLRVDGPMTASDAGRALGQNPSNISWHLRKLAGHGLVRQDAGTTGRRRPWRIVAEALPWADDADETVSVAGLRDVAVEREVQLLRGALAGHAEESDAWRKATSVTPARLWLTADEATELGERVTALAGSTADRLGDPGLRPEGARLVAMMTWLVPARPDTANESS